MKTYMRYMLTFAAMCFFIVPAYAGIDDTINNFTAPIATIIDQIVFFKIPFFGAQMPLIVLWLVIGSIFFTFYMGFVSILGLKHAIELVRGDYYNPNDAGEVSHFQALATAVSGTVGIGNIGGVAIAVTIGGAGATFWMILAGFLAMSTKFVECTLGVKYRQVNPNGSVSGGPMYFIRDGLAAQGKAKLGRFMGTFYAIVVCFGALGIGNMFQVNQAYVQLNTVTGGGLDGLGWLIGLIIAAIIFAVTIGGIKSIARVTETLVPFMGVLYCLFAIIVIAMNAFHLPTAIMNIFTGAFTAEGVAGGAIGALIIGFQRAVFSNEAGLGSASIAHAAVKTKEPLSEGYVALLEPFIDTIVICTITALVIGTSQVADPNFAGDATGVAMTSAAFERQISWFPYVLAIAVLLFAFSTILSWSYYGLKGWTYLFGESTQIIYKLIFCAFVIVGCTTQLDPVLIISDALIFLLCVPNVLALYFLAPVVKLELGEYRDRIICGQIEKYKG